MRSEFEKWLDENNMFMEIERKFNQEHNTYEYCAIRWIWESWQHQQSKVDGLQNKNAKLVHALVKANEKSSHWAKEYWKGVERSAEYQAILLKSDNELEVDCFKKEKEIERLHKQVYELEQALKGGGE
ncbi:hypothetical protein [Acinetobacter colistiniresistens]|uniref:hypothetical protein n=1 Tax=Acinetobacter colistiniresistens TaxID=280145 RepID=UPI000BDF9283|nr:hypothetical protein [Acinetobacter colistiniresistens]